MSKSSRDKAAKRAERAAAKLKAKHHSPAALHGSGMGQYDLGGKMRFAQADSPVIYPDEVRVDMGRNPYEVMAGPFSERPVWTRNLCLTEKTPQDRAPSQLPETHYHFPIPDFGVPSTGDMARACFWAYRELRAGRQPYVGCLGGIGRTGTFLGCLMVLGGLPGGDAVGTVRSRYLSRAIETQAQMDFVKNFRPPLWMRLYVRLMG